MSEIRDLGFSQGLIVGDRAFVAGNLRFRLPRSQAVIPEVNPGGLRCRPGDDLLVAWDADRQRQIPGRLGDWLTTELGLYTGDLMPRWLASGAGAGPVMGVVVLPGVLEGDCRVRDQ